MIEELLDDDSPPVGIRHKDHGNSLASQNSIFSNMNLKTVDYFKV
jgi:hypothetical protein